MGEHATAALPGPVGAPGPRVRHAVAGRVGDQPVRRRDDRAYFSLGASGGVAAVLFSFILFAPWQTIYLFVIPIPAIVYAAMYTAYSLWAERRGTDNVNHSAHLAGALFGVLATLVIEPEVGPHFVRELLMR